MTSTKRTARIAGFIYLIVVITGLFSIAYVPETLVDWQNSTQTLNNFRESELLFRFGLVAEALCYLAFLILPLALYKLFKHVNHNLARLMVIFAIVGVSMSFATLFNKFDILTLLSDRTFVSKLDPTQIEAQLMFSLDSYYNGVLVSEIFWGLWLLPFGILVYKSGMIPKFFGIFLILGCAGYLIEFVGDTIFENYFDSLLSTIAAIPSSIGEIGTCLWLLIMGAKQKE